MNIRKNFKELQGFNFCFYCSVDSDELKTFLIIVIGGLVAASLSVALGAYLKGHFKGEDARLKEKVLEVEGDNDG